jgi:outer membrane lipoprotein-sorting protein
MNEKEPESISDIVDRAVGEIRSSVVPPELPPELLDALLQAARANEGAVPHTALASTRDCPDFRLNENGTAPFASPQAVQLAFLTRLPTTWRWMMRSPVSRAMAASVFVCAVLGVVLWFHGSGATPAFADFLQPIREAKTVKFKVTIEMKGPPPVTTTGEAMVLDAARTRFETEMPDRSKVVTIEDLSQGKQLTLEPKVKAATMLTFAPERTSANGDPLAGFRSLFLNVREKPDLKRKPLGEKEIDGRRVIGFRITIEGRVVNLWGDPRTVQPVCVEMTAGMDGSTKVTASDFVFNTDMDESLFSVEPPAGYTVRYEKFDATPRDEMALIAMFREYSRLTGTLPDSLDREMIFDIVWKWGNAEIQWERVAPGLGKVTEEQKRRYKEILVKKNLVKEIMQLQYEITWDNVAPENVRANEEQKQRFLDLIFKTADGKVNNEQFKKGIREIGGDQMLKAMDALTLKDNEARKAARTPEGVRKEEARTQKFMESQRQAQRGVDFVAMLSPASDAHYVGKGVSPGAADKPIFWYRPHDSKKYRVIYADLSVREADTPPGVPHAKPVKNNPSHKK